ncbi:hypothetical protein [Steroidobacter sp.]|uniref:hypothetical protein n=1 Tax=Steroidobacter sp. TaxID=1978227 RepID=UPI001A5AED92|nr:hypothetical protein [Steroidobacter sp.]MBL8269924.1 hypothetical protein [Steroidobacter sp.]
MLTLLTSQSRIFTLIAIVWWAALLSPTQTQRFAEGLFDGVDMPAAVASVDRHLALYTKERRRSDSARDGNPPAAVIAVTHSIQFSGERARQIIAFSPRPAAEQARSPAQPRAPPVATRALAG